MRHGGRILAAVLVVAMLATPAAWAAPDRELSTGSAAGGWLAPIEAWLAGAIRAIGHGFSAITGGSQAPLPVAAEAERGPELDPNGGTDHSESDRGPEIDPDG